MGNSKLHGQPNAGVPCDTFAPYPGEYQYFYSLNSMEIGASRRPDQLFNYLVISFLRTF